jgi:hypothetical protein
MFWKKSDTDYINSVRRWVSWSKRFAVLYAVISIAWVAILVFWHLMLKRISSTFELDAGGTASLNFMMGGLPPFAGFHPHSRYSCCWVH